MTDEFDKTDIRRPRNNDFEDNQSKGLKNNKNKGYGTFADPNSGREEEPTDKDGNVPLLFFFHQFN